jgi:hypothetical protein
MSIDPRERQQQKKITDPEADVGATAKKKAYQ